MRFACMLALLTGIAAGPALADVTWTQTTTGKAAFLDLDGETVMRIKGNKMRVEYTRAGQTSTTILDIDGQRMISLDPENKRASITKLAELQDRIQQTGVRDAKTKVTATGETGKVAGHSCKMHDVSVSFPFNPGAEGLDLTVVMSGPACLSKTAPGYAEYASFLRVAAEKGFIFGDPRQARGPAAAQARGIASLYRAMAEGGVVLRQQLGIRFEAPGTAMAAMMNEMGKSTFTNVVTKIETEPLPRDLFEIPEGFTQD